MSKTTRRTILIVALVLSIATVFTCAVSLLALPYARSKTGSWGDVHALVALGYVIQSVGLGLFSCVFWCIHFLALRQPEETACCPKCSYNLEGHVAGICPECGTTWKACRVVRRASRVSNAAPDA